MPRIPPCPPILDPAGSAGATERSAAIAHYTNPALAGSGFSFKVYGDETVREALNDAFNDKCAYCESDVPATSSTNVEHYRPKGEVQFDAAPPKKPGYYWLATTWENFLPACTRCNSKKLQAHADGPLRVSGKANYFPLADESKRATAVGQEADEEPLLLNPYFHDPDEHLTFSGDGLVHGLTPKGHETIRVLGLNRSKLVRRRRKKLLVVDVHIRKWQEYDHNFRSTGDPRWESARDGEELSLFALIDEDQEYTALVADRLGARP
jgi:uncharacterized protein (TIGR02646 family)